MNNSALRAAADSLLRAATVTAQALLAFLLPFTCDVVAPRLIANGAVPRGALYGSLRPKLTRSLLRHYLRSTSHDVLQLRRRSTSRFECRASPLLAADSPAQRGPTSCNRLLGPARCDVVPIWLAGTSCHSVDASSSLHRLLHTHTRCSLLPACFSPHSRSHAVSGSSNSHCRTCSGSLGGGRTPSPATIHITYASARAPLIAVPSVALDPAPRAHVRAPRVCRETQFRVRAPRIHALLGLCPPAHAPCTRARPMTPACVPLPLHGRCVKLCGDGRTYGVQRGDAREYAHSTDILLLSLPNPVQYATPAPAPSYLHSPRAPPLHVVSQAVCLASQRLLSYSSPTHPPLSNPARKPTLQSGFWILESGICILLWNLEFAFSNLESAV
ncbi:hypothetical protein B0H17DRAFT_1206937 [Mycena rosella]|uniref:Uncharacterized protein n=1 Tax=Mycena rosella TaxID=1033263 RepID=A0AAD7GCW3_MYCRO|nr:hypothetical protein B0H17DRAFT_1206937 [Mycena rosella]